MKLTHLLYLCFVMLFFASANAQYRIEVLDSTSFILGEGVVLNKTSFRGLSVVDDKNIWVSGSRGTFARSTNGGKTFVYTQLKGYEKADFRDIEAFDDKRAVIMSSGTPAYILKTRDGGQTWKEVYKNTDSAYFLDAMDFWDKKRGILVGDPVNGHFVLLQTSNGGESWVELDTAQTPQAMEDEAVFAASGTSLRCWGNYEYAFVSGGKHSRILYFDQKWHTQHIPIQKGLSSQGAFSIALADEKRGDLIVAGGDYMNDTSSQKNACFMLLHGHLNRINMPRTHSYKSSVEMIGNYSAIATGTRGTELYYNFHWKNISTEPFNVVRKAKKGNAVFLAGPKGKIGKLIR